jgi:hypothetical protein
MLEPRDAPPELAYGDATASGRKTATEIAVVNPKL